jgi:Tfp pilus assembly protein PilN
MKAVNLIPADERRGANGAAGASGGAAHALLGALLLIVVMAGAYTVAGKDLNDKRAELTKVNRDAAAATAKAAGLAQYTQFSQMRARRVDTVKGLATSRFDWAHALREVSRTMPSDAWLTTLVGTVTPGVQLEGGSTGAAQLRTSLPSPAIEISGCTTTQKAVARVLTRLRLIDGVVRVSLAASKKSDAAGGAGGGSASGGDCRNGSDRYPQFDLVVFFKQPGAAIAAPSQAGATGTAATASTTPGAGQSTPASTTTPSSQPASGGTTP